MHNEFTSVIERDGEFLSGTARRFPVRMARERPLKSARQLQRSLGSSKIVVKMVCAESLRIDAQLIGLPALFVLSPPRQHNP
jgi:hypothetical protein